MTTATLLEEELTAVQLGASWLEDLTHFLEEGVGAEDVIGENATWRDVLALSWEFTNYVGRDAIVDGLAALRSTARPRNIAITKRQLPQSFFGGVLVFFDFETQDRVARGYARLDENEDGVWRASTVLTQAEDLIDHPKATGRNRVQGKVHGYVPGRTRWSADRTEESAFSSTDPSVVVVGAGHNGLSVAAQLKVLGVPTLVIDKVARVGDTWRTRYQSLALHSLMNADHLAYYPFPPSWTEHTPKDKFADHLESYANAMDLAVWPGTSIVDIAFDEPKQRWNLRLRRPDGTLRTLHPRHVVFATGLNGKPKIPHVDNLESFTGVVEHSGEFQGGADFEGKKVIVVGSGVSGHEIAHDLHEHGAEVTMLQRSATYVINFTTFTELWYGIFGPDSEIPIEFADMVFHSMPLQTTWDLNKSLVAQAKEIDKELLDGLEAHGFKLEWGPDGTGLIGKHLFEGRDSYQINCGASELIADGSIAVQNGVTIASAKRRSIVLSDGTELDADAIIFATGYEPLFDSIKTLLGASAEKVTKVYGLAEDGEYSETWRRSGQPGLWFATGFVAIARYYSHALALQIRAIELGLIPFDPAK